jgi:hypothetical protein
MGYTHHWSNSKAIDDSEWDAITTAARKILRVAQDDLGIALSEEYDVNRMPVVTETEIRFNGYADEGHETFMITREPDEYSFCKTARKPYDTVVIAMLQLLGVYASGFDWRSEGDRADHAEGLALYNAATGANWDYTNVTKQEHTS